MDEMKHQTEDTPQTVTFRTQDRVVYGALNYDGTEMMAVISGYDLDIRFNMQLINSLTDAEACANALADVFYESLMEQLLAQKGLQGKQLQPQQPIV